MSNDTGDVPLGRDVERDQLWKELIQQLTLQQHSNISTFLKCNNRKNDEIVYDSRLYSYTSRVSYWN